MTIIRMEGSVEQQKFWPNQKICCSAPTLAWWLVQRTVKILIIRLTSSGVKYLQVSTTWRYFIPVILMNLKVIFRGKARLRQMTISKWEIGHLGGLTCLSSQSFFNLSDPKQNLKFCWLPTGKFVVTTTDQLNLTEKVLNVQNKQERLDKEPNDMMVCGVTKNFLRLNITTLSDLI